ncbi:MAG: Coenzyme F420 hydrogenase/dehydrogenase, beta subunit C-terminal domain [Candidatus Hydrothermarchaeales archaeon]
MANELAKDEVLQYTWLGREEGFTALEHEIIYRDLCSGCGTCAGVCPEDVIAVNDFPKLVGDCTNCGYCLIQCPRSFLPRDEIEEGLFGKSGELLGNYTVIKTAKSKTGGGQDGGFVTALINYMLKNKLIDGAIVSGLDEEKPWTPRAVLATTAKAVKSASGTRYTNSPNNAALREAKKKGLKRLAIVGLPCQIEGIRKIIYHPVEKVDLADRIKYTVAIFCSKNYLKEMLQDVVVKKYKLNLKKITKFDIKGKNLLAYQGDKKTEIPLTELNDYVRKGCKVCPDFTGKLADFSVGAVGSTAGFSTVMARTKEAAGILGKMEKAKLITTQEVDVGKSGLGVIERLSQKKESKAKKHVRERVQEELPLPFKFMEF